MNVCVKLREYVQFASMVGRSNIGFGVQVQFKAAIEEDPAS